MRLLKTILRLKLSVLAGVSLWFAVLCAGAATMHIEDESLTGLPPGAAQAVVAGDKDLAECKIVGKRLSVPAGSSHEAYFATTADGCLWGAHSAPLWVVWLKAGTYHASQVAGGYALETLSTSHNGLIDVRVRDGSAGYEATSQWYFDGRQYREDKTRRTLK